jgi:rhamnose transport system permease protein
VPAVPAESRFYARALRWETLIVGLIAVAWVVGGFLSSDFYSADSFTTASLDLSEVALMALPLALLIVAAEIDLSVASVLALSSACMGELWNAGQPIELIMVECILIGAACGAVNGVLVTRFGLPSLAVTIGTLSLFRGLAFVVIGDQSVTDFPATWTDRAFGNFAGTAIPNTMVLFAALAIGFGVLLHATGFGRKVFAIGANEEAARFSGVRVKRLKLSMFVTTGVLSALTGVFWALHYASARYDNATGLELSVIAAVLLGGIDFDGGKGTLGGAIAGVFLLGSLQNVMSLLNVSAQSQIVVTGVLLVISVLAPRVGRQVAQARARRRTAAAPPPTPVTS